MSAVLLELERVCRACSDPFIGDEINLMESPEILELYKSISTTQVEPNDHFPKSICMRCNLRLDSYKQFQKMCINSYQLFLDCLAQKTFHIEKATSPIKVESTEEMITVIKVSNSDSENSCDFLDHHEDLSADEKNIEFDPLNVHDIKLDTTPNELQTCIDNNEFNEADTFNVESDDEVLAEKVRKSKTRNYSSSKSRKRKIDTTVSSNVENVDDGTNIENSPTKLIRLEKRGRNKRSQAVRKEKRNTTLSSASEKSDAEGKSRKVEQFKCDRCPKTFMKKEVYQGHMRQHEGLKPFACDKCNKKYSRLERLRNHVLNDHSDEPMRFCCNIDGCDKKYRNRETLKRHINSHFNPPKPPLDKSERQVFICELCGKQLSTKGVLKEHEMMHRGEFPYACDICPRRFRVPNKLYLHKLRHQGIKKFECKICGLKKTTNKELKSHMNIHTREKQYPCKFCDIIFLTNGNLVRHVQVVHDGIKLYSCTYCDKAFGKAETLRNHTMKHTGERPLPCPHCERRFISRTSLQYHIRRHERDATEAKDNIIEPKTENAGAIETVSNIEST